MELNSRTLNFLSVIRFECSKRGTAKDFARELGISQQYLSDLMNGKREPSDAILAKFGLKWVIAEGLNDTNPAETQKEGGE